MRRGDLVIVATSGDYGKPRPALVVRADAFAGIPSVTILPLTTELHDAHLVRITVPPAPDNGLRATSQVMIDKAITVPRARVCQVIGQASADILHEVDVAVSRFLGLA